MNAGTITALSEHPIALCALIGVLAFSESLAIVGIFTPGIALLAAASATAGAAGTPLSWLLAAGWIGAALGDGLSFLLGRHIGPGLRDPDTHPRLATWIDPGEQLFGRYGVLALVVGRFLGPIRPVLPLAAGMLRMRTSVFMMLNATTALVWSPAYLIPGYLMGAAYGQQIMVPANWPWALLAAFLVAALALRAGTLAGRLGRSGGTIARRVSMLGSIGHWLGHRWPGTQDTPLTSLLSASGSLLTLVIPAALAFASGSGEPWRAFAHELLETLRALW